MFKNKFTFWLICCVAIALTACGGSGGSSGGGSVLSGKVVDGYIRGATVCLDLNKNGVCDTGEPSGTTGVGGAYTLTYPENSVLAGVPVLVNVPVGAVDESEGAVTKVFFMSSPADVAQVISPFSTMAVYHMKYNPGLTYSQAVAAISQKLLGTGVTIDPTKDFIGSDPQLAGAARALVAMMQESSFARDQSEASYNSLLGLAPTMAQFGYQNPTAPIANIRQQAVEQAATLAVVSTVKVASNTYQASPTALAVGSDNSLYAVDGSRVLKLVQNTDATQNATVMVLASGFTSLNSVAVDPVGNVYVTDGGQVFKVGDGQKTLVTGSAGLGLVDGALSQAKFSGTLAIVADGEGNLRVADTGNNVLRKIDLTANTVSTYDFSSVDVALNAPAVISIEASGIPGNEDWMRVIDSSNFWWLYKSNSSTGAGSYKPLVTPFVVGGMVRDSSGFEYYTDTLRSRIIRVNYGICSAITRCDPPTESVYSGGGSAGNVDGPASSATFNLPTALVKGPDGAMYVADVGSRSIRKIK